jgi:hypothetical protein
MSAPISPGLVLELLSLTQEEINHWCVGRLEAFDYVVEKRGAWEHLGHLLKRLHISASKFRRRMKRYPRETTSFMELGPSGRTIRIRSSKDLDRFLSNGKKKNKAAGKARGKKRSTLRHKSRT